MTILRPDLEMGYDEHAPMGSVTQALSDGKTLKDLDKKRLHQSKPIIVIHEGEIGTIRRQSGVFAGKQGFITLRDLFRWAERYTKAADKAVKRGTTFYDWDQDLANNGYMLLAGRVRRQEEADVIADIITKHFKRPIDATKMFTSSDSDVIGKTVSGFGHIVWTHSMSRLAVLVEQALKFSEPVLLVGETGCGKTTVVQLFAEVLGLKLFSINCHLHTESADFLGGLRPVRHRQSEDDQRLFEWCDGPLVQAMRGGAMLMVDEISLADDSVLERLNSVLEPERCLLLAEKGGGDGAGNEVEEVRADDKFRILATMNPGGDYGKKELSPALRNRFTEIWCPESRLRADLVRIIEHNLKPHIHFTNQEDGTTGIGKAVLDFVEWMTNNQFGKKVIVSVRDLLSWVHFINATAKTLDRSGATSRQKTELNGDSGDTCRLEPELAYVHGACLVFVDGFGEAGHGQLRSACLTFLQSQVQELTGVHVDLTSTGAVVSDETWFGMQPFLIEKGPLTAHFSPDYALGAPTTSSNLGRLLRGLQLSRPLLLEGSPGVGKTSLVGALARAAGHELVRINLSDQTDVSDLFGADLPVEGAEGGTFAWRDGPFLKALKQGHWIVLDELNLASQSVLEGLNACLDHRGEVFVPELGMTFTLDRGHTRLFACQNPLSEGGGRKGLPKSFLNRFTQVYVEPLSHQDLMFITQSVYPQLDTSVLNSIITFNTRMHEETMVERGWGVKGGPWEFNLRDVFRWCQLLVKYQTESRYDPSEYVGLLYRDRMRTAQDKEKVYDLYESVCGVRPSARPLEVHITSTRLQIGHSSLTRQTPENQESLTPEAREFGHGCQKLFLLERQMEPLESLIKCVEMNWMAILLGPPSSGKSALVAMAAALSNRRLRTLAMNSDMDTTELLGGFEQADLGRHVGKFVGHVSSIVTSSIRRCLVEGRREVAALLMTKLHSLGRVEKKADDDVTMTEDDVTNKENRHLSRSLDLCSELLRLLVEENVTKQDLSSLLDDVSRLRHAVSTNQSAGGRFEWVDSVLVQALRDGDWLLIDNVNFCSPSVLDRLNALLEPGGVLTLNERGSDTEGRIPTIVPHQQFRLILSMDPRHGELSRAMRNRGVEIYMLGEDDGSPFSDHDLTRLLHVSGLPSPRAISALLQLRHRLRHSHRDVTVTDLVLMATSSGEQMKRGCDVITALTQACQDVLVKQQRNQNVKKEVEEMVRECLLTLPDSHDDLDLLYPGLWPYPLPAVGDYVTDSSLARVGHVTAPFAYLVSKMATVNVDGSADLDLTSKLSIAADAISEMTSSHDLTLISDWLKRMTSQYKIDQSEALILSKLANRLECIENGDFVRGIVKIMQESTTSEDFGHWRETPIDIRWNRQLMSNLSDDSIRSNLVTVCNKLHLAVYLEQTKLDIDAERPPKRPRHPTLLHLTIAVHDGCVNAASLSHPSLVQNLLPFLQLMDQQLQLAVEARHHVTDQDAAKLLYSLVWRDRFVSVCRLPLNVYGGTDGILPLLALHWNWLGKKTLITFLGESFSPEFSAATGHLDELLGHDDSATKLSCRYRELFGHPKPFTSQTRFENYQGLSEICEKIQDGGEDGLIARKSSSEISAVRRHVAALFDKMDEEEFPSKLADTREELDRLFSPPDDRDRKCRLALLPVLELFGHLAEARLLIMTSSGVTSQSDVTSYSEWGITVECAGLMQLHLWTQLNEETRWSLFPLLLVNHLRGLWKHGQSYQAASPLHSPQLSLHVSRLLSCSDVTNVNNDVTKPCHDVTKRRDVTASSVSLAEVRAKVEQLRMLGDVLWRNAEQLCQMGASANDTKLARLIVQRTLTTVDTLKEHFNMTIICPDYLLQAVRDDARALDDVAMAASDVGKMWVRCGLLGVRILAPRGPVDPAERRFIKTKYQQEEVSSLSRDLDGWRWVWQVWRGEILQNTDLAQLHPRLVAMVTRMEAIMTSLAKRREENAYRPQPTQFPAILQRANQIASTICSLDDVTSLVTRLEAGELVGDEVGSWQTTLRQAGTRLMEDFPLYGDLLAPFVAAMCQVSHGMSLIQTAARRKADSGILRLEKTLVTVCRVPSYSEKVADSLSIADVIMTSPPLSANHRFFWTLSRWKLALLHLRNHVTIRRHLDDRSLTSLQSTFDDVTQIWHRQERLRREREAEEQSLYKYKSRQHGDQLTETEREDRDRGQQFPTFQQEFADITETDNLNEPSITIPDSERDDVTPEDLDLVTDLDLDLVTDVHRTIFANLAACSWRRSRSPEESRSHDLTLNVLEPVLVTNECLRASLEDNVELLDSSLERHTVIGNLIATRHLLQSIQHSPATKPCPNAHKPKTKPLAVPATKTKAKPFDIYHDADVGAVLECDELLVRFRERVTELLNEWPEHPTLNQLILLTDRIRSFAVTSSVMKFVTGLELILQKAQDWESVAARHVSLMSELEQITSQVISWRKMELKSWSSCLDTVAWRQRRAASKWWFHLYQTLTSYVNQTDEWGEGCDEKLLEALQQFVETSTLGEFHRRLELVLAFHCHLVQYQSSHRAVYAMRVLWNVHQFYHQFVGAVDAGHTRLRQPIEKELKDFVKIAKWNDVNYWVMKQATEKTHRTLHKYIREYEVVLQKPAREFFTEKGDLGQGHVSAKVKIDVAEFLTKMEPPIPDPLDLSGKVVRMRKLCRVVIETASYPRAQTALDDFTGEIIGRVQELQALDVTTTDPEKRKSEVKHIHQRKRKALWDLFKYLADMGISYRKGLVSECRIEVKVMQQPCLDLAEMMTPPQNSCDHVVSSSWPDYQLYYLRCLTRHLHLVQSLASPSDQLQPSIVDRVRGLSRHLLDLVVRQRDQLAELAAEVDKLRSSLDVLNQLQSSNLSNRPRPLDVNHVVATCSRLVAQTIECLAQFELLLATCPGDEADHVVTCSGDEAGRHVASPFSDLSVLARMKRGDENYEMVTSVTEKIMTEASSLMTSFSSLRPTQALSNHVTSLLDKCCETFPDWWRSLDSVISLASGEDSPFVRSLVLLTSRVKETLTLFPITASACDDCDVITSSDAIRQKAESLTLDCLLVVQKFYKSAEKKKKEAELKKEARVEKEEEDEEDDDEVHVAEVLEEWTKEAGMMNIEKITSSLTSLIDDVISGVDRPLPAAVLNEIQQFLRSATPVLDQYSRLVQHHVTSHVTMNKVVCKMASVLQAIFAEVAQKGFCLPAAEIEQGDGEDATKFEDIEGGGLGQSEGTKDVSDQIETEDQLEDTHQKDQEQEQAEEQEPAPEENAIEMSGDVDGKMQDVPADPDGDQEGSEEEDEEEEELDKKMGEVEDGADKLDEQIWGDDEPDTEEKKDEKEESGPGDGQQTEAELVAKDENEGDSKEGKKGEQEEEEEKEEKINQQEKQMEQSEADDDHPDPYYDEDRDVNSAPDDMDLPDDLNLEDEDEEGKGDENDTMETDMPESEMPEDKTELPQDAEDDNMNPEESKEEPKEEGGEDEGKEKEDEKEEVKVEKNDGEKEEQGEERGDDNLEPKAEDTTQDPVPEPDQSETAEDDDVTEEVASETYGKTLHDVSDVQTVEAAQDRGGETQTENQEQGGGASETRGEAGTEGESAQVSDVMPHDMDKKQRSRTKPGRSESKRTLGSVEEKAERLQTTDSETQKERKDLSERESDLYQHISEGQFDKQTLDVASSEQAEEQKTSEIREEERTEEEDEEVAMHEDEEPTEDVPVEERRPASIKPSSRPPTEEAEGGDDKKTGGAVEGVLVETMTVQRGLSSIHTVLEKLDEIQAVDVERLRQELQEQLTVIPHGHITPEQRRQAEEAWQGYESITSNLSRELCEQLRLVLEPTQASKLRGDYRTGKRLNMRKVIPYIASQFRKDKIWLRRTKPSKRTYQIMLAVDDSSSMVDNHSKQLAFESLCLVSNALTLLEAGDLAIASFGENVEVLHSFGEQFTSQSGAELLTRFTFEQKKTKIAQLLNQTTRLMLDSRRSAHSGELSQLLLIVSDGRGLFLEGVDTVLKAVRRARAAGLFTAFVIIDNPENKDSILDIKVPVFRGSGQLPEIRTYMEQFPFPFYVILRHIEALPHILGDALRQWFELVTSQDR